MKMGRDYDGYETEETKEDESYTSSKDFDNYSEEE